MRLVQRHLWWTIPTLVVAIVVGLIVGATVAVVAYAVVNAAGTWLAVDESGFGPRSKRAWRCWATVVLLPVGILGVLGTRSADTPSGTAMSGSSEDTMNGTAPRIGHPGSGGPMGRSGLG